MSGQAAGHGNSSPTHSPRRFGVGSIRVQQHPWRTKSMRRLPSPTPLPVTSAARTASLRSSATQTISTVAAAGEQHGARTLGLRQPPTTLASGSPETHTRNIRTPCERNTGWGDSRGRHRFGHGGSQPNLDRELARHKWAQRRRVPQAPVRDTHRQRGDEQNKISCRQGPLAPNNGTPRSVCGAAELGCSAPAGGHQPGSGRVGHRPRGAVLRQNPGDDRTVTAAGRRGTEGEPAVPAV